MELNVDKHSNAILTIVERTNNILKINKLKHGKRAKPLAREVGRLLLPYKKYIRTITADNETEFKAHSDISAALKIDGILHRPICLKAERSY